MRISPDSLAGRVALVTGGGSGIGRSTAKLFAHAGARVGVLGRTASEIEETCEEINGNKDMAGEAIPLTADVTRLAELREAVAEIDRRWERLDIVFANAGVNGLWASVEDLPVNEFAKTIAINLTGTYATIRTALPLMKRSGDGGSIIITSSVNGTRMFSNTGATAYASSKAAQVAMSRMLAVELAKDRIRVNTVCPGAIATEIDDNTDRTDPDNLRVEVDYPEGQIPLTGDAPGTAGQVAETVWFLASEASSHTTGAEIFIDGAQSLLQG